jgi:hypothetical protein
MNNSFLSADDLKFYHQNFPWNVKKIFSILFISLYFLFILSNGNSLAQSAVVISKQSKKAETKKESVKQVKSARPDMTKSRGARPPDIVRPSGSRIPKGVGRPAGAGMHGR